jgi:hypothetical protein
MVKNLIRNIAGRFIRLGDWLSAGVNSFLLDGCVDESISGRSYRMSIYENSKKWYRVRKLVDFLWRTVFAEEHHCQNAYYKDLVRAKHYIKRHEDYLRN